MALGKCILLKVLKSPNFRSCSIQVLSALTLEDIEPALEGGLRACLTKSKTVLPCLCIFPTFRVAGSTERVLRVWGVSTVIPVGLGACARLYIY